MATTCAQMCEMMMDNPSMMKRIQDEIMEGLNDTRSDSKRTAMTNQSTMRTGCARRRSWIFSDGPKGKFTMV